jgi:signal transduction histidine kinase
MVDPDDHREVAETLLRTAMVLTAELEIGPLLQKLTDEATRLCRAQFGAFFYDALDDAGERYLLYTVSGTPPAAFENFQMPREQHVRADGVVRVDDIGPLPVRSYLAVPVKSPSGKIMGALSFGHAEPGVFRRRDEELVVALAAQAAVALDNARLFEEVRTARDLEEKRASLAEDIGLTMTGSAPISAKLERSVEAMVKHLGAAAAWVWTRAEAESALELRASAGTDGDFDAAQIERIAQSRRAQLSNQGPVAFAGYPLLVGDEVLGVLAMIAYRPLPPATLRMVGAVANQLAVAIERDRVEAESERFRALFLGMLGHDLRNPLSAISTGTQALLLMGDLSEFSTRTVERMLRSVARMGRMVTQILDFTRARSPAGIPVARVPGDLHEICRDVLDEIAAVHPGRELRVSLSGNGKGDWDPDRMAQVLSNLVGNALEYGQSDQPVEVTLADGNDGRITGSVRSFGPPIPEDVLPALFDPFRRGAAHRKTASTQGLGLGLFISKHILAAHGGDIRVSSSASEGTLFAFELPRRAGEAAA